MLYKSIIAPVFLPVEYMLPEGRDLVSFMILSLVLSTMFGNSLAP